MEKEKFLDLPLATEALFPGATSPSVAVTGVSGFGVLLTVAGRPIAGVDNGAALTSCPRWKLVGCLIGSIARISRGPDGNQGDEVRS